jgi:hypothetical protein
LFPQANGFIDGVEELGADLHVIGGKPASYSPVLQITVQPANEFLIPGGVADETRIELPRLT